ncbi:terminase large subunit [Clostridium perfringens]|uniref:terminase large subunit n=1 Tax=Clostridium perfringens TaxID=1502 RepID=UPI0024BC5B3C|nr:terminase TerL endonuclease subunit [Clostridium perfringens]
MKKKKNLMRTLEMYNTVLEELIDYSNKILNGEIIACKRHKQACQRFLNDLENMEHEDYDYYWDEKEAQRIVKWYSYCKHSKGVLEGQPIVLNSWAKFVVCNIEAWKHKDTGYRRFRFAFIQVGRKNAKSQLEAGMSGYEVGAKGYNAAEVYTLGVERDQAKIVFDEWELMTSKPLKKKFKFTQKEIRHKKSNSFIKHLSKKAGKTGDGKNPQMAIIDEYHAHPNSDMYDVMKSGMMARTEPLLVIITTAGMDYEETACYYEYLDCCSILDGTFENDKYFVMICELEKEDDPFNEEVWLKANPVLCTYPEGIESMRENAKLAKNTSNEKKRIEFFTKNCNIYVAAGEKRYVDVEYWKACKEDITLENFRGHDCYIGIDLSKSGDLTSIAFEFPYLDGDVRKYAFFGQSFIPSEVVNEKMITDNVPYELWSKKGWLIKTEANDGLIVDFWSVLNTIQSIVKEYDLNVIEISYDPHGAAMLVSELERIGYICVQCGQSCAKLNEATVSFRDLMKVKQIVHDDNKLMTWCVQNAETDTNSFGEIKISKKSRFKRIDPLASSIFAHNRAMTYWNRENLDVSEFAEEDFLKKLWGRG